MDNIGPVFIFEGSSDVTNLIGSWSVQWNSVTSECRLNFVTKKEGKSLKHHSVISILRICFLVSTDQIVYSIHV